MAGIAQTPLVGFADIRTQAIDDWQEYKAEGKQYLRLAEAAFANKNKVFTGEILYNLVAMGIEKVVMGALMEIGRLPYNHTMHDLVDALVQWMPESVAGMEESIRGLDSYQEICDPYACTIKVPTPEEIASMLALARELEQRLELARA